MRIAAIFILTLVLAACVQVKKQAMFDTPSGQSAPKGFSGFYATQVFDDYITNDVWFSKEGTCLSTSVTEKVKHSGKAALHLKWDKVSQECPFIGIGFGWDVWNGKNLSGIINQAAIEMWFKLQEGSKSSLPLAACLEDFSGRQAWLGFSSNVFQGKQVDTGWTRAILPLSEFDWRQFEADPSNIKQLIIQFEADGNVYLDDIQVIPYSEAFRKRVHVPIMLTADLSTEQQLAYSIDGKVGDFQEPVAAVGEHQIFMAVLDKQLYIAAEIQDISDLYNPYVGDSLWNGDALELAFGTVPRTSKKRPYYLSTDQHIGIRLSITEKPMVWNWQKKEAISTAKVTLIHNANRSGYSLETLIPLSALGENISFQTNQIYGFEIAIDQGDATGRIRQIRWNNPENDGFHQNPSLWGEMLFTKPPTQ